MEQNEILEGNRLIAEFMGWKELSNTKSKNWLLSEVIDGISYAKRESAIKDMKFCIEWNWLMPVVEKIESLYDGNIMFTIKDTRAHVDMGTQYGLTVDIEIPECYSGFCKSKIEGTYSTCLQFIKWYNQNK